MRSAVWDLFMAFTRSANLGFGGGPATIPLMQNEVVKRYHWMNDEEFADALAVGNTLPGPIATKMAALIGYKAAGWPGAIMGLVGTVIPTLLVAILLSHLIDVYTHSPQLKAMLTGVRPVVVILIAQTAISMGKKAFPNKTTVGIAVVAAALLYFNVHPALIIIGSMVFGYFAFQDKGISTASRLGRARRGWVKAEEHR
ncbi:chromate transport protein [Peptococcaceae bacterium CEB3]|nr:chromate transport protein [Peptococcaceae bacterium CEB3]